MQYGICPISIVPVRAITEEAGEIRLLLPFDAEALTARQMNEQLFQWLELYTVSLQELLKMMVTL